MVSCLVYKCLTTEFLMFSSPVLTLFLEFSVLFWRFLFPLCLTLIYVSSLFFPPISAPSCVSPVSCYLPHPDLSNYAHPPCVFKSTCSLCQLQIVMCFCFLSFGPFWINFDIVWWCFISVIYHRVYAFPAFFLHFGPFQKLVWLQIDVSQAVNFMLRMSDCSTTKQLYIHCNTGNKGWQGDVACISWISIKNVY